jgi:predicted transport protein
MSDLKLFAVTGGVASELPSQSVALEKHLQLLIEDNMLVMFAIHFLAREYSTGKVHGGRIDSLGLDENGSPVIFEYKRTINENVINQGLFYLDWLMDHQAEYRYMVQKKLGAQIADEIDWSTPRLICVANDFTKYDEYAVRQIDRNIELVRYRDFGSELIAIELVSTVSSTTARAKKPVRGPDIASIPEGQESITTKSPNKIKTAAEKLGQASPPLAALYDAFEAFALSLGEDVVKKDNAKYFAFRRLKNFACVEVHPMANELLVYLRLNPQNLELVAGFLRDVSNIGHYGTGDLEVRVTPDSPWSRVEELTRLSYLGS